MRIAGIGPERRQQATRGTGIRPRWNLVPSPLALDTWSVSGTPEPVAATDPLGGETAWLLTDDDAGLVEQITSPAFVGPPALTEHTISLYVLKDEVASGTRVVGMIVGKTGSFVPVKLDTSDGTTQLGSITGMTDVTSGTVDRGDWWQLWVTGTSANVSPDAYDFRVMPAFTDALANGLSSAATGSATFWRPAVQLGATPTP